MWSRARLRDAHLRARGRHRGPGAATDASSPLAGPVVVHRLPFAARRGHLRGDSFTRGLALLEVNRLPRRPPPVPVLCDACAPGRLRLQRGDLRAGGIQLSFTCLPPDTASTSRASTSRTCASAGPGLVRDQPASSERTSIVQRRIDAEEHVALLHRPVVLDGHLDDASLDLRDDRHAYLMTRMSVVLGAKTFSNRISVVRATTGMIATVTFHGVPWQELELDEDEPDEETSRCREEWFPSTCPHHRTAAVIRDSSADISARIALMRVDGCRASLKSVRRRYR